MGATGAKLGIIAQVCVYRGRHNLGCIALAVSFSGFHSGCPLIWLNCHVDKQPVVRDLFFAGLWIAGNSRQGEQIMP